MWLNLQKLYELRLAEQTTGEEIKRIIPPITRIASGISPQFLTPPLT